MRVVTLYSQDFLPGKVSIPVLRRYCERWNYACDFFSEPLREDWVPSWNKILALEQCLTSACDGEWLLWIDSDVLLLRPDMRLETLLTGDKELIFSTDIGGLCAGFFLIRKSRSTAEFLTRILSQYDPAWPWEQAAIKQAYAEDPRLELMTSFLSSSVIQNPRADFNPDAFAIHFWANDFGYHRTVELMKVIKEYGWLQELFQVFRKQ